MGYKLYGVDNKEIRNDDLQNKGVWCRLGETKEQVFVNLYGNVLNLIINPEKVADKFAPDLLNTETNIRADLKVQNTPFFQAKKRFSLNPQDTVVFNLKDRKRYKKYYPEIDIYFAVDWQAIRFQGKEIIEVSPMIGVWNISFRKLDIILENAPVHSYQQRTNDKKGNAKDSYVLSLNHMKKVV